MLDPDDLAYKKSVRNMSLVLGAIVITVFAAIFASPYLFPTADTFQTNVTGDSPFGFTMHLQLNSTDVPPGGHVLVAGWLNASSDSIDNVTAMASWGVGPSGLVTRTCTAGWPLGVGVMKGHYTQDNYTLGALLPSGVTVTHCPVQLGTPTYFLFSHHSSKVLVDLNGTPQYWVLQSSFSFGYASGDGLHGTGANQLPAGVYTAVLATEWGDVLTTNFRVS